MAIKDWKIYKKEKYNIIWIMKKYPQVYIQINKRAGFRKFNRKLWRSHGPSAEGEYKTKAEALRYAKAYMRKH